jgi:hypothetical protein
MITIMGVLVMMMMMTRMSDSMTSITTGAHIFQALEPVVRLRFAVKLKLKLNVIIVLAMAHGSLKRSRGAIGTLGGCPSEVFCGWRSRSLAYGPPNR